MRCGYCCFFSLLVNLRNRGRVLLIGGIFVAVSGIVYFAFMAAWLNIFLLVGYPRAAQIALAIIALAIGALNAKDFFAFRRGPNLGIPESAKPGIYARSRRILAASGVAGAMGGAAILALLVNAVELACTAGLPALYTNILSTRSLPAWSYYGYLILYNFAYILDDLIVLTIAVITLRHFKLAGARGKMAQIDQRRGDACARNNPYCAARSADVLKCDTPQTRAYRRSRCGAGIRS